jgi:hypothetical protein
MIQLILYGTLFLGWVISAAYCIHVKAIKKEPKYFFFDLNHNSDCVWYPFFWVPILLVSIIAYPVYWIAQFFDKVDHVGRIVVWYGNYRLKRSLPPTKLVVTKSLSQSKYRELPPQCGECGQQKYEVSSK